MLLAEDHRVIAGAGVPIAISRPHPLWSEQDPADWWSALDTAMLRLREAHRTRWRARARSARPARCMAPCCSTPPTCGAAPGDPVERRPKRPAVRGPGGGAAGAARHRRQRGDAGLHGAEAALGARARAGDLRAHRARAAAEGLVAASGSPASTSARCPTPRARSGSTSAGATGPTSCWPHAISRAPDAAPGRGRRGVRRPAPGAGCALGMRPDLVAGGGGDNAASAVGVGAVHADQGFVSLGTSGVCLLVSDRFRPNPGPRSTRSAMRCRIAGTRCR